MEGFKEPEFTGESLGCHKAFIDYFDGMIMGDTAAVHEASHRMEHLAAAYADEMIDSAYDYEQFRLDGAENWPEIREIASRTLKTYVYSGVTVDRSLVLALADQVFIDKSELRLLLKPTTDYIESCVEDLAENDHSNRNKDIIKLRGLRAMRRVGVSLVTDRWQERIIEIKLKIV
ncbi:hypothetical protein BH23PAT2_BH23PAT2_01200 [soil metagenome]